LTIELQRPHRWDLAPYKAQQTQLALASAVVTEDDFGPVHLVAGIEVAHSRFSDQLTVAVAVMRLPEMVVVEKRVVEYTTRFPFIPDLVSFREVPAIVEALAQLRATPDLLIVGAPGVAHAKGLGTASHVGVVTGIPTIGCARANSVGSFVEPEIGAGSVSSLVWQGEIIGVVYRSKNRVAPLFISSGHRVSRDTAARLVREQCHGYRFPEPLRHASNLLNENRQSSRVVAG